MIVWTNIFWSTYFAVCNWGVGTKQGWRNCADTRMFQHRYVQTLLCSDTPMFRHPYVHSSAPIWIIKNGCCVGLSIRFEQLKGPVATLFSHKIKDSRLVQTSNPNCTKNWICLYFFKSTLPNPFFSLSWLGDCQNPLRIYVYKEQEEARFCHKKEVTDRIFALVTIYVAMQFCRADM